MSHISARPRWWLRTTIAIALTLVPETAGAWAIGSQINETGCHEPITAEALRRVRAGDATLPRLAPSRDEAALIADVPFQPPGDLVDDLAGMTLLLGVRDNDLRGVDPLSSFDLIQVHGNPMTQDQHCIRGSGDDDSAGNESALEACRSFIRGAASEALDGLDANGNVDPDRRVSFEVDLSLAGQVHAPLPLFYVKIGAAMHALEDGFAHTYRTPDGMAVTVVLNWIDRVDGATVVEARDGPPHRAELDHCWNHVPLLERNFGLAIQAASELLSAAADPTLTRDDKVARFDAVTAKYLGYQAGCTFDNQWCDAPEAKITESGVGGCSAGGGGAAPLVALVVVGLLCGRRGRELAVVAAVVVTLSMTSAARADTPPDSPLGFTVMTGAAVDRTAVVGSIGVRYRVSERWLIGLDAAWNPWITTSPVDARAGVAALYATLIRRFPMRYEKVSLRTSAHLGVSTLLFDVYGAPMYSTGPYIAFAPLGIDYALGGHTRLVVDPIEFAIPIPEVGQLPLYYEQFRFMIGLQVN